MLGKILESQKYREAPPCGWCLKQESDPRVEKSVLRGLASPDQHTCSLVPTVGIREGAGTV